MRSLCLPSSLSVTLSIGVAAATAESDFESLFASADRALYEAKRRGRDAAVSSAELAAAMPEPTVNIKHFVGREREIKRLVRHLDGAFHGEPRVRQSSIRREVDIA